MTTAEPDPTIQSLAALIPQQRSAPASEVGRFPCCGVPIAALSPSQAVAAVRELALSGDGHAVHLCNAYVLALASKDAEYAALLSRSALNLPDGTPVTWAGRKHGYDLDTPVRGPGLMLDVMRDGVGWGAKHYVYGSTPQVIEALSLRLPELVPGVNIVGLESPPFRDLTDAEAVELQSRVRDSGAHYVWVGLGTPRQDAFVDRFARTWPGVTLAVGAAFDFAAGTKKEAPKWMHGTGLEWTHRLASEPGRLWKRYLFGNTRFATQALLRR